MAAAATVGSDPITTTTTTTTTVASALERFGAPNGVAIDNLDTILQEVDRALGRDKPPAVEYLFVSPFHSHRLMGFSLGMPFGHAALRYTLPDGRSIVMNVMKNSAEGEYMVNFIPANEYLYGVSMIHEGAEQGGAYNRRIIGVRIENVPADDIRDMHYFFERLHRKTQLGTFDLLLGPVLNWMRKWVPSGLQWAERGNCARWTSAGLVFGGLLPHRSMWPKALFIHLMERHANIDPNNVNVVEYEFIKHAYHEVPDGKPLWLETVQPFAPFFSFAYFDLSCFARARVVVPANTTRAVVEMREPTMRPSWWRYRRTEIVAGTLAGAFAAARLYRHFTTPRQPPPPRPDITRFVQLRRMLRTLGKK